ncbi:Protein CBR-CHE-13 [Caenorhabditis briggsae]|uniref:Protein CBR-CHE-13 n=2 Tax=Caenorhabditis briggsae TaxID=6238 RepID=A8WS82_CAEBR|nr:Protein CBR-CHE-13 [Caenorhabditis briggsae]CAP23340.2 Protein CBR-CHE-13 [Caenorhabditis briggsae]
MERKNALNVRKISFRQGVPVDFTAAKLKSGAGENVISILSTLADAALVQIGFQWQKMIPPKEEDEDTAVDEQDDDDDDVAEEPTTFLDDDDDDNVIEIDLKAQGLVTESKNPLQSVLQSTTDSISWKQEVERVAPQLKITLRQDAKDWRLHLEQMNSMHKTVEQKIGNVGPFLDSMSKDIGKTLERISVREKSLNTQLSSMMSKFKRATDTRAELREKYKAASVGVSSRTETLDRISDDIEQLKQQIEEQGAKSSDGAPLVKIKQAVSKLEEALQTMNVQIGALEQSILNTYLRDHFNFSANLLNIV